MLSRTLKNVHLGPQVAEVMQRMLEMGEVGAAAELLDELAQHALSVACDTVVQLVGQA